MEEFGSRLFYLMISVRGYMTQDSCTNLLNELIKKIEMTPAHQSIFYSYPSEGKGGVGFTCIQPITESFIAVDAWPDLNGAYIAICSCREFSGSDVFEVLSENSLEVIQCQQSKLRIEDK